MSHDAPHPLLPRCQGATIVANIHGHTHEASGHVELSGVPVINPGALVYVASTRPPQPLATYPLTTVPPTASDRRYGFVTLRRDEGRWRLEGVQLHTVGDDPPEAAADSTTGASGGVAASEAVRSH